MQALFSRWISCLYDHYSLPQLSSALGSWCLSLYCNCYDLTSIHVEHPYDIFRLTASVVYYGTSLNIAKLTGHLYLNIFVSSLIELPALVFAAVLFRWYVPHLKYYFFKLTLVSVCGSFFISIFLNAFFRPFFLVNLVVKKYSCPMLV